MLLKLPEIWCRCNFQSKTSHVGDAIGEQKEHTDEFSNFIQVVDQENNLNGRKGNIVNKSSVLAIWWEMAIPNNFAKLQRRIIVHLFMTNLDKEPRHQNSS